MFQKLTNYDSGIQELEDAGEANGTVAVEWPKKQRGVPKKDQGKLSVAEPKDRHGKAAPFNPWQKTGNSSAARERPVKAAFPAKPAKAAKAAEPQVKEEGEISDADNTPQSPPRRRMKELDKDSKEGKWHEWCAQIMDDQAKTLNRLEKLQTSDHLSKEEVPYRLPHFWTSSDHCISHK